MFERFTDKARQVYSLANDKALELGSEYIGSEHVLLAILEQESEGRTILFEVVRIGLKKPRDDAALIEGLQYAVKHYAHQGTAATTKERLPLTPKAKRAAERANEVAGILGDSYVDVEHVLMSLLYDEESIVCSVFDPRGVSVRTYQEGISRYRKAKEQEKLAEEEEGKPATRQTTAAEFCQALLRAANIPPQDFQRAIDLLTNEPRAIEIIGARVATEYKRISS